MFNVEDLPLEEFAEALGLPNVPYVKFIPGDKLKQTKNAPHPVIESDEEQKKPKSGKTKHERMSQRHNQTVLTKHYEELRENTAFKVDNVNDDEDDEIFSSKRKVDWDTTDVPSGELPVSSLSM